MKTEKQWTISGIHCILYFFLFYMVYTVVYCEADGTPFHVWNQTLTTKQAVMFLWHINYVKRKMKIISADRIIYARSVSQCFTSHMYSKCTYFAVYSNCLHTGIHSVLPFATFYYCLTQTALKIFIHIMSSYIWILNSIFSSLNQTHTCGIRHLF